MSECKHGLEPAWCALCDRQIVINSKAVDRAKDCSAPHCKATASTLLGSVYLCQHHIDEIESLIVRHDHYKVMYVEDVPMPSVPWVYFVQIGDAIKIGYSRQPDKRLRSFASYGQPVRVLALERGGRALEKKLHRRFSDIRHTDMLSREMFVPERPLLRYIEKGRSCYLGRCDRKAMPDRVFCGYHAKGDWVDGVEDLIGMEWNVSRGTPDLYQTPHQA